MLNAMLAWIGHTDLKAADGELAVGHGPIAQAAASKFNYSNIILLNDHGAKGNGYATWLKDVFKGNIEVIGVRLPSPTDYGEIYKHAVSTVQATLKKLGTDTQVTFHLSPGTPAMAAVWIILSKTRFPAQLIESSKDHGVKTVNVPFDISADFIPDLLRRPDEELVRLAQGLPPEAPELDAVIHRCKAMKRLVLKARRLASRNVAVLILGESGTGKELLARAIHKASPRREGPFIAVNCGAIPKELAASELFGHVRGAFTGAVSDRKGYIELASGGTLFLDEIGDLPLFDQVKLLRVLQDFQVTPVGAQKPRQVDIRVLSATNRDLQKEMLEGRFREDLFHRLAVGILMVPPLREREGDLQLLLDRLLAQVNGDFSGQPGFEHKKLSVEARKLMLAHPWPGNVRELLNTLQRAAIGAGGEVLDEQEIREALLPSAKNVGPGILEQSLGEGFSLKEVLRAVARQYLDRAMKESAGNKTKAAALLGLPNYQTLSNWLERYGLN